MPRLLILILLACSTAVACTGAAAPAAAVADSFTGVIATVLDGDSMRALRDGREVEIRLHGIDAPEGGQAFGNAARRFLINLVRGKSVRVDVVETDSYGRLVARVTLDGVDVGLEVIRAGCGWHYTRYSDDARYAAAEREARQARRGLWADDSPVAPWEFRQQNRAETEPAARAGAPTPSRGAPATASGPFHGNVVSRVFHAPGCDQYACKNCTAVFATYEAAVAAGYRPHQQCVRRGP